MTVHFVIEGGGDGDSESVATDHREAFRTLIDQVCPPHCQPQIVRGGGTGETIKRFEVQCRTVPPDDVVILLLDAERPIVFGAAKAEHIAASPHLDKEMQARARKLPEDRLHLMATCTESWVLADRPLLRQNFCAKFDESKLPDIKLLEQTGSAETLAAFQAAAEPCGGFSKKKGLSRTFLLLREVRLSALVALPHARAFFDAKRNLSQASTRDQS